MGLTSTIRYTAIGAVGEEVAAGDVEKLNQALLDTVHLRPPGRRGDESAGVCWSYRDSLNAGAPYGLGLLRGRRRDLKSAAGPVAVGNAYGYQAGQLSLVSDIIAKTAASSMADVADMSPGTRQQASTVAQQYGVSLRDTATGPRPAVSGGYPGVRGGHSLPTDVQRLIGTSKKAQEALDKLGVSILTTSIIACTR